MTTATKMRMPDNGERANWQFRNKFTTRRILNFLVFAKTSNAKCERIQSANIHTHILGIDKSNGDKNRQRQFKISECITMSFSLVLPTNERSTRQKTCAHTEHEHAEHLNLRRHYGPQQTFNSRHNCKTKRFNYTIMSSCLG